MNNWQAIAFFSVVGLSVLFGWIGSWMAKQCGRDPVEGVMLGALLGPLGLIIEGLLPKFPYDE